VTSGQLHAITGAITVATVVAFVFSLALGVSARDALWLLRRPGLLLRSLLAALVVVPAISILLVMALWPREAVSIALVLLAVSPAAPLMLSKAGKVAGDENYAPSLQLALATLAIATVPLSLEVVSLVFPTHEVHVPSWAVAQQVGKAQLLPLLAGIVLRSLFPGLAGRLARPIGRLANVALLAIAATVLLLQGKALLQVGPGGLAAVALTAVAAILVGHLLGGPRHADRGVLAVACSLRNPGLALLVVHLNFPGRGAAPVVLTYVLVTGILLAIYGRWWRRRAALLAAATVRPA